MKDGFRNIIHILISLLLGLQLIHISLDSSRLSYAFHAYPQLNAASDNNQLEDFAALFLGINLETDNTSPESDESETGQEQNEGVDFFYTRPDAIQLSHVLFSDKNPLNQLFAINLENVALDTTSPPPKH